MSSPKPEYLTDIHVGWNSSSQPGVLLKNTDTNAHVLKWKNTDVYSKQLIHSLLMSYANKNNLSEAEAKNIPPTGGWQSILFNKIDVNASTGILTDTNGYSSIVFKEPVVDVNFYTQLPVIEPTTGFQRVKYEGLIKSFSTLGFDLNTELATQGFCTISFKKQITTKMLDTVVNKTITLDDETTSVEGLPAGSNVGFYLNIGVDKHLITYTIKEKDTLGNIITQFNKAMKPFKCVLSANEDGHFIITNPTFGKDSVISITDIDVAKDTIPFFSNAMATIIPNIGKCKIVATTGIDSTLVIYKTNVKVDGVDNILEVSGNDFQHDSFISLIILLNKKIPSALFSVDVFGHLQVMSKTTGEQSSIQIIEEPETIKTTNDKYFNTKVLPLFSSIVNFQEMEVSVNGKGYGSLTTTINNQLVSITPTYEYTYAMLLDDIKKSIQEEIIVDEYKIVINSSDSNPLVMENDEIFSNMPNVSSVAHYNGFKCQHDYHCMFNINNQLFDIIIDNNECSTFIDLMVHVNELLEDVAVAEIINNNIVITSKQNDNASCVKIVNDQLFKQLNGFLTVGESFSGITTMDDIFTLNNHNNQPIVTSLHGIYDIIPHKPLVSPKSKDDMYFNHKEKTWKYLVNDSTVN
jgi:hypothetical protein